MSSRGAVVAVVAGAAFVFGVGVSDARPARGSGAVTISMLELFTSQPAWSVLISNFERVYPNIKVDVTYEPSSAALSQVQAIELAAGNAPDLFPVGTGCSALAAGDLAPMVKAPWVKWSLPLVTSVAKCGQVLYGFTPTLSADGVFTNDDLFRKLGLKVPQTFAQLLDLCQKAKAAGTPAVIIAGGGVEIQLVDLAVATVYGKDRHWNGELKAGQVSFDGTPGWHQALQKYIDMNNAGCFEPGVTGTTLGSATAQFAQGQGLMFWSYSLSKGTIDAANPQFAYSFYPLPDGTEPNQTRTLLGRGSGALGVNAYASSQNQAAAQTFIDFIARPKQNALLAQISGGLTQYEVLKGQIPSFMAPFKDVFKEHAYVVNPILYWWNANVGLTLSQNGIGLITGQRSIDDILNAMDAAWKQGPS